ncbi:MAG: YchJ family metal-binding protein [Sulfurospirillum sp.]
MKKFTINSLCPCGSGKKYKKCCAIFHKGALPKSALELMKSRYSAYATGDIKYLIKTSSNKDLDESELKEFSDGEKEAFVTFKATVFCEKIDNSFIEKSRFIKAKDRWLYVDGEFL